MINKLYATYRPVYSNNTSMYTCSFFLDKQFADYKEAGLTATLDNEIPTDKYIAEIAPGIKKQTRFMTGEYNADHIVEADYRASVEQVGSQFQIEIFATVEEAREWIRANTDLKETDTPGTFIVMEEHTDDIDGEIVPAKYLEIV